MATERIHAGRSWTGHQIEDECPCPQAPCGLVDMALMDDACPQHSIGATKTIRQLHYSDQCPGGPDGH